MLSEKTQFNHVSTYAVYKENAFYLCKYYVQIYGLKIVNGPINPTWPGPFWDQCDLGRGGAFQKRISLQRLYNIYCFASMGDIK